MAAPMTAALGRSFRTFFALKRLIPASAPAAGYHAKPPKASIGSEPYMPDRSSDKTPEWQLSHRFDRKLYGRYGDASGIEPATLWPSAAELEALQADEAQWQPPLDRPPGRLPPSSDPMPPPSVSSARNICGTKVPLSPIATATTQHRRTPPPHPLHIKSRQQW
ncbi:hypothetical protein CRUP_011356 [Coryphaenoides rupestris]|nr:hypothetical protein CRUP_011356 [Coryphaenoides rupestris]